MKQLLLMLGGAAALMLAACGDADAPKAPELGPDTAAVESAADSAPA